MSAPLFRVHIEMNDRTGTFDIHKAGCRDVTRSGKYEQYGAEPIVYTVSDELDCLLAVYGPACGSYFNEMGLTIEDVCERDAYAGNTNVCACAAALPDRWSSITVDERAARWGDDRPGGDYCW